jgi:putative restriction endonuclease
MNDELDIRLRLAAFQWLAAQTDMHGEALPRALLEGGFDFEGVRVPLVGPQGIFKPRLLADTPLSITTVPDGPYQDTFSGDLISYAYRGTDPRHRDNIGLRRALANHTPLVYFFGERPGWYRPVWPVFVVGDRPRTLHFDIAADDANYLLSTAGEEVAEDRAEIRRRYVTAVIRQRLHQRAFRARVLTAYRDQCALCRLRHGELLDAAHITPDTSPEGEPVVSNGLSLCKLHHAAFDGHFLTVRPDYVIEVRRAILDEADGPMLLHGLQAMHRQAIVLPRAASLRPDRARLEQRYEVFRQAG